MTMNNKGGLVTFANNRQVDAVRALLAKSTVGRQDVIQVVEMLDKSPTILNHLALQEISKLSTLGVDLSRYLTTVHMNNIKVFVIKFASDSMMRVSKLISLLNMAEEKYYQSLMSDNRIHPKVAAEMIDRIQESITASVNLMMKLTDNETLMNLLIVNMTEINNTITDNKQQGYQDTKQLLPLESRKKMDKVISSLLMVLNEASNDEQGSIDAVFEEKEGNKTI